MPEGDLRYITISLRHALRCDNYDVDYDNDGDNYDDCYDDDYDDDNVDASASYRLGRRISTWKQTGAAIIIIIIFAIVTKL